MEDRPELVEDQPAWVFTSPTRDWSLTPEPEDPPGPEGRVVDLRDIEESGIRAARSVGVGPAEDDRIWIDLRQVAAVRSEYRHAEGFRKCRVHSVHFRAGGTIELDPESGAMARAAWLRFIGA